MDSDAGVRLRAVRAVVKVGSREEVERVLAVHAGSRQGSEDVGYRRTEIITVMLGLNRVSVI